MQCPVIYETDDGQLIYCVKSDGHSGAHVDDSGGWGANDYMDGCPRCERFKEAVATLERVREAVTGLAMLTVEGLPCFCSLDWGYDILQGRRRVDEHDEDCGKVRQALRAAEEGK